MKQSNLSPYDTSYFSRSLRQNIRTRKLCMALKFKNPASFIISGRSGVEKTKWILCLVDNIDKICPGINQIFIVMKSGRVFLMNILIKLDFVKVPLFLTILKSRSG